VIVGDGTGASLRTALPNAQHDAQAAALGGHVYVFGGGQFTQYSHILAYDPIGNRVTAAGSLPAAASDVAVAAGRSSAYVVGGFDGVHWLNTVLTFTPHQPPRELARLPVPLRYASAAVVGNELLIAGGSTPTGASRTIYRVGLADGAVSELGHLPAPITHAGAGTLAGEMYLVGGRGDLITTQRSTVYAIDPATGRVHVAGHLPRPLSDAAVVSMGGRLIVAGGSSAAGTQATVGELIPRR
jgi:N-acetylneuraminic acid mutarotase